VRPGQYVLLSVTDTGRGMSREVAERAFDPFFTTKELGRGTGLGLSMVYGFVKQSGGHVKIYTELGHGTSVKIYLPRYLGPPQEPEPPAAPEGALPRGAETVLVVEDDELVRLNTVQQLESLGYRVAAVADARGALDMLERLERVHLLFTDVIMPGGMNGRQLAEEAQRTWPGLKVLFASGYTPNSIVHHGRLDPGIHLVTKPYRKAELARKVRRVLDE
jgi:CheY-like chemotaxis protein